MDKKSILVVDDEKDLQKLLEYNLKKEGYEVLVSGSGKSGLELARLKKPDLVILDLMLPGIGGLDVCRLLQSHERTRSIPVLILTARSSEADHVSGLELGAVDYLTKPFSVKVLLVKVKNALKTATGVVEPLQPLRWKELILDKEKRSFEAKGKPVSLTNIEFKIMCALMDCPQTLVSSEQLVRSVWGDGSLVSKTAVNMQIKNLRKKLGSHRGYIQTVRGLGYRFC
jgi:two-component system phosphate regulon response regulator PhoB